MVRAWGSPVIFHTGQRPSGTLAKVCQEFHAVLRGAFGPRKKVSQPARPLSKLGETLAGACREDGVAQTEVGMFLDALLTVQPCSVA